MDFRERILLIELKHYINMLKTNTVDPKVYRMKAEGCIMQLIHINEARYNNLKHLVDYDSEVPF
jgi:hypothetical protein